VSAVVEQQIERWRTAVLRGPAMTAGDADELESHLRDQIAELEATGLSGDEAFLIAMRRLGQVDTVTAEFAREHGERLWKQLAMVEPEDRAPRRMGIMIGFAALVAVLVQIARLAVESSAGGGEWILRDMSLLVLPALAAYFAVLRRTAWRRIAVVAAIVVALAVTVNLFPFEPGAATSGLVAIHLPVVLWLVVGAIYVGEGIRSPARRMDFIRFSGEWLVYYALIALGGAVLVGLAGLVLTPVAPSAMQYIGEWVIPTGAGAAVIVAAWLVEAKKSVIENMAPVLTAIFTPLFTVMLLVAAVGYAVAGVGREFDRDLLIVFDVLLLVVLGLVVYGISARDRARPAGVMDTFRLVAVVAAIALDLLVLVSMFDRVGEFGFTANRVAALGLNILLLINLAGTAWLLFRMHVAQAAAERLERWQTDYLPVFAGWAIVVLLVLPPLFGFA